MNKLPFANRLAAFIALGQFLEKLPTDADLLAGICDRVSYQNAWFTPENVKGAINGMASLLSAESLENWASSYPQEPLIHKKVGVVMAGNLPFVGFHDMLCVLISGHTLQARFSSTDTVLPMFVIAKLIEIEPLFAERVEIAEQLIKPEAIIATGGDNTGRYFDYYFGKYPSIIRRNRNSLALISGKETKEELEGLAKDILQYFGLGCRSISQVLVPENYNWTPLFEACESWNEMRHNHKYFNNYEYQKSILLINKVAHWDNGFLMITENVRISSAISVLHFLPYKQPAEALAHIRNHQEKIQCIVGNPAEWVGADDLQIIPFGTAQTPSLYHYADGIDTMKWLSGLV